MFAVLISMLPLSLPFAVDRVEIAEYNVVVAPEGGRLEQFIWWEWVAEDGQWKVVDWRVAERSMIPSRAVSADGEVWVAEFLDRRYDKMRRVVAAQFMVTFGAIDIEVANRKQYPIQTRRGLRGSRPVE